MSPYLLSPIQPNTASLELSEFDVTENGFLPADEPLGRLKSDYYQPWETVTTCLPELVKAGQLHEEIRHLPTLSTAKLHGEDEWRRAYVLLTFMTHAYIWGGDTPMEVSFVLAIYEDCAYSRQILPPSLSMPLIIISQHLELPPVATYASLCLWNYQFVDAVHSSFEHSDGLRMMHSITGTDDESWFYLISVMVEGQGARSVPLMVDAMKAAAAHDYEMVIEALNELRRIIEQLGRLLERMYERCKPQVFYHEIRPVLAGSKNMAEAGLPRGVYFDLGDGRGDWTELRGGSNAQSSLIQFFDAVLGVVHKSTGEKSGSSEKSTMSFHDEMRLYMPGQHRRFLERITKIANIREHALAHSLHPLQEELRRSYQEAIEALSAFRGIHMQIVARYIIIPSRQASKPGRMNLAVASQKAAMDKNALTGTGGTDLVPFLKQTREETDNASKP
jgi:indoleamine 2,3-dioxygenase